MAHDKPFWESKSLEQMDAQEWESLCDHCGRCCLNKLEDIDSGEVLFTDVACRLYDTQNGGCTAYAQRLQRVPDCVLLDPHKSRTLTWLPRTCAYRLLAEKKPLPWWHPLVSGSNQTVLRAGIAVRGRVVSEYEVAQESLEEHVITWVR